MDLVRLDQFSKGCSENLADSIDEILKSGNGKKPMAIGFITTDDFYGFYLSWEYTNNIEEYYDWEQGIEPDFLYQPLVDIVDSCEEIEFCNNVGW